MRSSDTSIGGPSPEFPSTVWSTIVDGRAADEEARRSALETLARAYWKPIYCYLRCRWAKSNEEAKDLTQDFFGWVLETRFFARADRRRGRFRAFVKVALNHYVGGEERKRRRKKRGGARMIVSLDTSHDKGLMATAAGSPEEALDNAWKAELLARAAALLADSCRREGRESYFLVFRDFFLAECGTSDYAALASKYGITEVDVSNYLMRAKLRYREILKALVAETVGGPEDLQEEMKALFGKDNP